MQCRIGLPRLSKALAFLCFIGFSQGLNGKTEVGYGLKDLFVLAQSRYEPLAVETFSLEILEKKQIQAKTVRWFPEIKNTTYFGLSPKRTVGSNLDGFDKFINELGVFTKSEIKVLQPIYTFGRLDALNNAAKFGVLSQKQMLKKTELDLENKVAKAYNAILFFKGIEKIIKEVKKKVAEAKEKVEESIEIGDGDSGVEDLLKLKIRESELETQKLGMMAQWDALKEIISVLTGIKEPLKLKDRSLRRWKIVSRKFSEKKVKFLPFELKALDYALMAKSAQVDMEKASYFPQFFLGLSFSYAISSNKRNQEVKQCDDPLTDNDCLKGFIHNEILDYGAVSTRDSFDSFGFGWVLGFEQNLAFHQKARKVSVLNAEYAKLKGQKLAARQGLKLKKEEIKQKLMKARHIVKTQRKAFKAARNLFRISAENFDLGTIDTEYLLSSYGTYVEQEFSYLKALFDRNNSYFDYLQINGQSIFKK